MKNKLAILLIIVLLTSFAAAFEMNLSGLQDQPAQSPAQNITPDQSPSGFDFTDLLADNSTIDSSASPGQNESKPEKGLVLLEPLANKQEQETLKPQEDLFSNLASQLEDSSPENKTEQSTEPVLEGLEDEEPAGDIESMLAGRLQDSKKPEKIKTKPRRKSPGEPVRRGAKIVVPEPKAYKPRQGMKLEIKEKIERTQAKHYAGETEAFDYTIKQRENKHDLEIKDKIAKIKDKRVEARITGIKELKDIKIFSDRIPEEKIELQRDRLVARHVHAEIRTPVFAVNESLEFENATITLPVAGPVDTILHCPDFNQENGTCPSWHNTTTPFKQENGTVTFSVEKFSAWCAAQVTILNVHSSPTINGNWTVRFTTKGTANLTITAVQGTLFGRDLKFLTLKCGNTVLNATYANNKITYPNYACQHQTSYEISQVKTPGEHVLRFDFGGATDHAYNLVNLDPPSVLIDINISGKAYGHYLLWKTNATGTYDEFGGPVILDDRLFITSKEGWPTPGPGQYGHTWIACLNHTTGAFIWNHTYGNSDATPAVKGERVYHLTYNGFSTAFIYNATTGAQICNYTFEGTATYDGAANSPLVADGRFYFSELYGTNSKAWALNATDCTPIWNVTISNNWCTPGSSLSYYDDKVYIPNYNNRRVYVKNATTGAALFDTGALQNIWDSSPVIADDKEVFYIGTTGSRLYSRNLSTGAAKWYKSVIGAVYRSPAYYDDLLFFGMSNANQHRFYIKNATTGNDIYTYDVAVGGSGSNYGSTAIVKDQNNNELGFILTTNNLDSVYLFNLSSGTPLWNYQLGAGTYSAPAVADGILSFTADDWYVYAFDIGAGGGNWTTLKYDEKRTGYCSDCLTDWQYVKVNCTTALGNTSCTVASTYDRNITNVTLDNDFNADWYNSTGGLLKSNSSWYKIQDMQNKSSMMVFFQDVQPPAPFDLVSPADGTYSSDRTPLLDWQDTVEANFANYTVQVSDVSNFAHTNYTYVRAGSVTNSSYQVTVAWPDQTKWYWRVIAYDVNGLSTTSTSTFVYFTDTIPPNATLNKPAPNYVNDSLPPINVTFNCSATDAMNLSNISLYITNSSNQAFSRNQTTTVSGTSASAQWTLELKAGNYTWNCLAKDKAGNQDWGDQNRSVIINEVYNTSFYGVKLNESAFSFSSATYVKGIEASFNTSQQNLNLEFMSSMNVYKQSGIGTSEIWVNLTVDGKQVLEEKLRTVTGFFGIITDEGSTGTRPVMFNVSNGEHNLTLYFRRTGFGAINVNDIDLNLGKFKTTQNKNVSGQLTDMSARFANAALTEVYRVQINKTAVSPSYIGSKFTLNASAATTVACRFFCPSVNASSPFFVRYLSGAADVGSVGLNAIKTCESGTHNLTLECLSSTGATVDITGTIIDFELRDNSHNFVNNFEAMNNQTNYTLNKSYNAGTHTLVNGSLAMQNGTSVFLSATASFKSTTGAQTPTIFINSTTVPAASCYTKKERYLSNNNDIGNVFIYYICSGLTPGNNYNFSLWLTVPAGETVEVYDEGLSGFEVTPFDITTKNIPPLVAILHPDEGDNITGMLNINWTTTDEQGDKYLTNITISSGASTTVIASNLPYTASNYTWDSSSVADGYWNLTVQSCENETADLYCGQSTELIFIDNTGPTITLNHPADNYVTNITTINFNWTASEQRLLPIHCNLTIDGAVNQSNISTNNGTPTNYTVSGFAEGDHNWSITCWDANNNIQTSETRAFIIDTRPPSIYFLNNTPASGTAQNETCVTINISVSDATLDTTILNWNGSTRYLLFGKFRREITIDNTQNNETLTDYQMLLTVPKYPEFCQACTGVKFTNHNQTKVLNHCVLEVADPLTVWVKVDKIPANSNTTIWMHYSGEEYESCTSDCTQTFSYDELVTNKYVVSAVNAQSDLIAQAGLPNTTIKNDDSGENVTLNMGQIHVFNATTLNATTGFSSNKPFCASFNASQATDTLAPVSFSGKRFSYHFTRDNPRIDFMSIYGSGLVNISLYTAAGALVSKTNASIVKDMNYSYDFTTARTAIIESDIPVMVTYVANRSGSWADSMVMQPVSTEIFGVVSNNFYVSAIENGTNCTAYYSDNTTESHNFIRGERFNFNNGAQTQGQGTVVRVLCNKPVGGHQQADGDGVELTAGWSRDSLGNCMGTPLAAQYVVAVCPVPGTIIYQYNSTGSLMGSASCTSTKNSSFPGKYRFTNIPAGTTFYTNPGRIIYGMYETASSNDEENMCGLVQSRKFTYPEPTYSIGNSTVNTTYITICNLSEGIYYYNATANDTLGQQNSTETRNITIDFTKPGVQFVPPTTTAGNHSQTWIFANVTATDNLAGIDTITIYLYNGTEALINTTSNSTSPLTINFTGLADGTYYINATANNTAGNKNNTETRKIYLDNTPPYWSNNQTSIVATYSPTTQSYFNITWADNTAVDTVYLESNFSGTPYNYSMNLISGTAQNGIYNFSRILPAGSFYWKSHANDTLNNWNHTIVWNFVINKASSAVNLTLNNSKSNITIKQGKLQVDCALITPASGTILLYRNGTLVENTSAPISTQVSFDDVGFINVTCVYPATQNYSASSDTLWVNVTPAIDVTILEPDNNTNYNTTNLTLLAEATNNNRLPSDIWYSLNGGANTSIINNRTGHEWITFGKTHNRTGKTTSYVPGAGENVTFWKANATGTYDEFASPIVYNGIVYSNGRKNGQPGWEKTFALNSTTGAYIWNFTIGGDGADGAPTYDPETGLLYIASLANSKLWCLNSTNGAHVWNYTLAGGNAASTPAIGQGLVYIYDTFNGHKLYAVNKTTGKSVWNYTLPPAGQMPSSPTYWKGHVFACEYLNVAGAGPELYAVNATTGTQIWNSTTLGGRGCWDTSPVIKDEVLYIGDASRGFNALHARNGTQIWRKDFGGGFILSTLGVANGRTYGGPSSAPYQLYALNTTNGNSLWNFTSPTNQIYSLPATADNTVVFGSRDGYVYAVNATSGAQIWRYTTTAGDGPYSSAAIVDGIVYIGGDDWYLYAIGKEKHFRFTVPITAQYGTNTLTVYTNNSDGVIVSETIYFNVSDVTKPAIQFVPPTTTAGNHSQTWIFANVTATDSGVGLDTITINLYNATGALINTTSNSTSPLFINFTGLPEGTYYLNATANDTAGNFNSTETRTIVLKLTPIINNITDQPDPQGFGLNVTITANITNAQAAKVEITPPGGAAANYTMTKAGDIHTYNYADWTNGTYTYRIFMNDSSGVWYNSSQYAFHLYQNLSIQVRTLKDLYGPNETINLTDPPDDKAVLDLSNIAYETPTITNAYVSPTDVIPGDKMLVSADVSDKTGIRKVTAEMPHEKGTDILNLNLTNGTKYDGTWQETWDVHDTLEKEYQTTITAENEQGRTAKTTINWTDGNWALATSFADPGNVWANEPQGSDGNAGTHTDDNSAQGGVGWGQFIILNLSGNTIYSNAVRVNADFGFGFVDSIDADVYNGTAWVNVYQGAIPNNAFKQLNFTGQNIEAGRFRFHYIAQGAIFWLYEFQFYNTTATITAPNVSTENVTSIEEHRATLHARVIDDGGEPCRVRFQYGPTTSYGTNTSWQTGQSTGDLETELIMGLLQGQQQQASQIYHFRAQINNSNGTAFGKDINFTTEPPGIGWVSPCGFQNPTGNWSDETFAYDDEFSTSAKIYHNLNDPDLWQGPLILNRTSICSRQIRFYAKGQDTNDSSITIYYKNGSTTTINTTDFPDLQWVTNNFTKGRIHQAAVKLQMTGAGTGAYKNLYEFDFYKAGPIYNEFEEYDSTSELCGVGINNVQYKGLILGDGTDGKIEFNENVTLNESYNLDNAVEIGYGYIYVNSTMYPSLNKSANLTMYNLQLGYPTILKDGTPCTDCTILSWNTNTGKLIFNVSSFSNYSVTEANQSKIENHGPTNASFYLFMKVQYWNATAGVWEEEDIVINDSSPRKLNESTLLKLDTVWNPRKYSTNNLSYGDGTYRVYAAALDDSGNVLMNLDGSYVNTTYNFTYDATPPKVFALVPSAGSIFVMGTTIEIAANVTDSPAGVDTVLATILYPNSTTTTITLTQVPGTDKYNNSFAIPILPGVYNITYTANDTAGNVNNTEESWFNATGEISVIPDPTLTGAKYLLNETAILRANVTSAAPIDTVYASVLLPNGTTRTVTLTNISAITYEANFTDLLMRGIYNVTFYANDTYGNVNNTETTWFKRYSLHVIDVVNCTYDFLNYSTTVVTNNSGMLDLEVAMHGKRIKNINISKHNENSSYSILMIDDEEPYNINYSFVEYAVDMEPLNCTNMTMTVTATGDYQAWISKNYSIMNHTSLDSNWTFLTNITKGQNYTFTVSHGDPGILELSAGVDVSVAPINNETFVVAFVDNNASDVSFKIMSTRGTTIVNTTDVDTSADITSRVDVGMINRTHFVIAWIDGPDNDATQQIWKFNGTGVTNTTGVIDIDQQVGRRSDISVAEIGNRYFVCFADDSNNDAQYAGYNNQGGQVVGISSIDGNMNPQLPLQNLISCAGLNSTRWTYNWFDDGSNDVSFAVLNNTGGDLTGILDVGGNQGERAQTATAVLDNDKTAIVWYDSSVVDRDIRIGIFNNTGGAITGQIDIGRVGAESRVAAGTIRQNATATEDFFVFAWWNDTSTKIQAAVYNSTGAQYAAPFTVEDQPNQTFRLMDLTARDPITNNNICPGYFVISYTNATGSLVFKGYNINGSLWDGVCAEALPDLIPINLSFSDDNPDEKENITIFATILNNGTAAADNITVQFYDGNCTNGTQIDGNVTIPQLNASQNTTINVTWLALPVGPHNIYVCVDPANKINESNETNNNLNKTLNVKAWQLYYGDVKGNLTLGKATGELEYSWNATDNGTIYITDIDEVFHFPALQALGRNTTGGNSTNDFADADTNLNMTGFNDSIQVLFAINASLPKQTTTFTVINRQIQNVPYINSTNTSNFITGILWDTTNDINGEYGIGENETLVFIANINRNAKGKHGIYDYEIYVPRNLAKQTAGTDRIKIYAELR